MADLFDYLDWRGDLSLQDQPFNAVDNLIFAELAYVDWDGVVPETHLEIDLADAASRFWELHTREEVEARDEFIRRMPLLMDRTAQCSRFAGTKVFSYVNVVDTERVEQFSAVTFRLPDGTLYVAFRGTDDNIVGWKEDFTLSYRLRTPGQQEALNYMNHNFLGGDDRLLVGGHSKGGNFAVYGSAFCEAQVRERIGRVFTNDGPGFRPEILQTPEYQAILLRVVSIIPASSLVGMLLSTESEHHVVASSSSGVLSHDGLSWQVLGDHFVEAERDSFSLYMDRTVRDWIAGVDDENRAIFIDTLFDCLSASGNTTISAVNATPLQSFNRSLRAIRSMSAERQAQFRDILGQLMRSGWKTLREDLDASAKRQDEITLRRSQEQREEERRRSLTEVLSQIGERTRAEERQERGPLEELWSQIGERLAQAGEQQESPAGPDQPEDGTQKEGETS